MGGSRRYPQILIHVVSGPLYDCHQCDASTEPLTSLRLDAKYRNIHNDISVRTMPLSHGQNDSGLYESSAFFIRHDVTAQEFLCLEHRFASRKECAHVESRYIERGRHEELNECLQGLQFSPLQAPRRRLSSD
ncbi:hypothetical protein PLICRDRAFT_594048 [Plicaturopsis crispa FD-325 SS-3]|nr:hypothetical protein PLICRDRAFT_594048 [Plicaturopsis crispa FD-325 SS-3]